MKPTKAQVKKLYKSGLSLKKIGHRFGVSAQTVLNWMRKWGLKRRPPPSPSAWDSRKKELEYLYHIQRMSQEQIADYFGTSQAMIYRLMKRLQIPRRSRGRTGPEHHAYKDGKCSVRYRRLVVKDQCQTCKATERLVIHHKNDDHVDNRLENLEVLCESCHNRLSQKRWWAKKRKQRSKRS